MMKMVYVVTEGDYSDFRVVGIFSTEEKASAYAGKSGMRMFECAVDALLLFRVVLVVMDIDGNVRGTQIYTGSTFEYAMQEDDAAEISRGVIFSKVRVPLASEAEMIERAVKVTNERRAFLIANGIVEFEHGTATKKS